ncbi:MAG: DUF971 domain-containing protein [Planctomycetota bacterium]|nr:MAG: DUF971 domain-containing protein [Planctomycetota bacterium]
MSSSSPKVIHRKDPARIAIDWDDGHSTSYTAAELRRLCPCANCVSETTGRRMLDPSSVSDDLEQQDLRLVGNYAIALRFSDGHETGIFPFPYLRKNDPQGT